MMGGEWAGLQTYAWVKMLWERSEDMGWTQAALDVISLERPCELCDYIQSERELPSDEDEREHFQELRWQPVLLVQGLEIKPSVCRGDVRFYIQCDWLRSDRESPPTPPPRVV